MGTGVQPLMAESNEIVHGGTHTWCAHGDCQLSWNMSSPALPGCQDLPEEPPGCTGKACFQVGSAERQFWPEAPRDSKVQPVSSHMSSVWVTPGLVKVTIRILVSFHLPTGCSARLWRGPCWSWSEQQATGSGLGEAGQVVGTAVRQNSP